MTSRLDAIYMAYISAIGQQVAKCAPLPADLVRVIVGYTAMTCDEVADTLLDELCAHYEGENDWCNIQTCYVSECWIFLANEYYILTKSSPMERDDAIDHITNMTLLSQSGAGYNCRSRSSLLNARIAMRQLRDTFEKRVNDLLGR